MSATLSDESARAIGDMMEFDRDTGRKVLKLLRKIKTQVVPATRGKAPLAI